MKLKKIFLTLILVTPFLFIPALAENNAESSEEDTYNSIPEIIKTLKAYPDEKSCLEKVNLAPVTKEEIDQTAICILAEIVKMGYPLCNQECLDQLTEDQLNKYFDMSAQQMKYLLDKELARR